MFFFREGEERGESQMFATVFTCHRDDIFLCSMIFAEQWVCVSHVFIRETQDEANKQLRRNSVPRVHGHKTTLNLYLFVPGGARDSVCGAQEPFFCFFWKIERRRGRFLFARQGPGTQGNAISSCVPVCVDDTPAPTPVAHAQEATDTHVLKPCVFFLYFCTNYM